MELKQYYRKNGYDYHLLKQQDGVAMMHQMDKKRHVAYEVGYVKVQKDDVTMPNGVEVKAGARIWSNEDIGRIAWSILDKDKAEERFAELVEKKKLKKQS